MVNVSFPRTFGIGSVSVLHRPISIRLYARDYVDEIVADHRCASNSFTRESALAPPTSHNRICCQFRARNYFSLSCLRHGGRPLALGTRTSLLVYSQICFFFLVPNFPLIGDCVCEKGSPYSITERRVPELIPVLGSQPAGDVSHKPGDRLIER